MSPDSDTIAAIATAPGEGAIAVVRLSGASSLGIIDKLLRCRGARPSARRANSFVHGWIAGAEGMADEVIVLIYRAPDSYTREDVVEIQGHGGTTAAKRILRLVLDAGARMAEAGEFTKRAFLNGRVDLMQAEAVIDLIRAGSDRAASAAVEQLEGKLSGSFNNLYDRILAVATDLESTLDFSDDELPPEVLDQAAEGILQCEQAMEALLSSWDEGHLLREGALAVICGKPNVGKSTLLNALLGHDRAIVTDIPGTTRDVIEEQVVIDGYPVRLIDTAGLRETQCEIEEEGIRRAKKAIQRADVVLYMIDGSRDLDHDDVEAIQRLPIGKSVVIVNKTDLGDKVTGSPVMPKSSVIALSLMTQSGLQDVKDAIRHKLLAHCSSAPHAVISERHRHIVVMSKKDVVEAGLLMRRDCPEIALAASRLRSALDVLGEATGRTYHDELLTRIFSKFCVGK